MSVKKEDALSPLNCIISLSNILRDGNWGLFSNEPVPVQKKRWICVQEVKQAHLAHVTQKLEKYFKECSL